MKKIFFILLIFFTISLTSAAGCCFDLQTGTCSPNVEKNNCNSGYFYQDQTCNSVSECDYGCCIIGTDAKYVRKHTCYLLSQSVGINAIWNKTDAQGCMKLVSSQKEGACILSRVNNEKTCKYVSKKDCKDGVFFENKLCSSSEISSQFNIDCSKTRKTICYKGNVHFVDSCGNPDEKKESCNFEQGLICALKDKKEAYCKNLNCVEPNGKQRRNGESWCHFDAYKIDYFKIEDLEKEGKIDEPVGSRFYRKFCINGEIVTEPCADFREEVCDSGKCVKNPWQECLAAGNNQKECDPKWCFMFSGDPGCGKDSEGYFCKGANNEKVRDLDELSRWGYNLIRNEFRPKIREDMFLSAGMNTCLPKYSGGFDLSYSKYSLRQSQNISLCSLGDVRKEIIIWSREGHEHLYNPEYSSEKGKDYWGIAGAIFMSMSKGWELNHGMVIEGDALKFKDSPLVEIGDKLFVGTTNVLPIEPYFIESFNTRCMKIGDCSGKINYLGKKSSLSNSINTIKRKETIGEYNLNQGILCADTIKNSDKAKYCLIDFKCMPYLSPSDGDCSKCTENPDYPCTEYKCKSISRNCDFIEDLGIDKAFCVKSSDISPPVILNHELRPKGTIPPFSSVTITLNTDEESKCKFQIGEAGKSFDEMPYFFGGDFEKSHKVRLNVPGKTKSNLSDESKQYNLLSEDGKYKLYVRCIDIRGNSNLDPYLIKFEVQEKPDENPPLIINFTPPSGSMVESNKTTKFIKFLLNEPAECRWDLENKTFSEMKNSFDCIQSVYERGIIEGYECSGMLSDISTEVGNETKFYIRCKDQPWLEGKEDKYYKRNENKDSFIYSLKSSNELKIFDFTPKNLIFVGPNINNITITVKTREGAQSGNALCKWKYSLGDNSTYLTNFTITNSNVHKQTILDIKDGEYKFYIECVDIANNKAILEESLQIVKDTIPPLISRIYYKNGLLKVVTNEPSNCKFLASTFSTSGCAFSLSNETFASMSSVNNTEHTGEWKKGRYYYIKCSDFYGNERSSCSLITKTL